MVAGPCKEVLITFGAASGVIDPTHTVPVPVGAIAGAVVVVAASRAVCGMRCSSPGTDGAPWAEGSTATPATPRPPFKKVRREVAGTASRSSGRSRGSDTFGPPCCT
ncbi:MAG: hypothetical protein ACYDDZ_12935 [Acidimicrobiales bacterium]